MYTHLVQKYDYFAVWVALGLTELQAAILAKTAVPMRERNYRALFHLRRAKYGSNPGNSEL
jgi:hypothetical protein